MVKLITVATHKEGYMNWLELSCQRYSTPLTVLGFGEKWQGFAWRFNLVLDYLKKLDSNELVCFIDAYDVLLLRPLEEIEKYYNKIIDLTNKKIIIAHDISITPIVSVLSHLIFGKCKNTSINAGTYIGKRNDIIVMLEEITLICKPSDDDQLLITQYINSNPHIFYIDSDNLLFLTINHPAKDILDNKDIHINNNILEYMGNKPFFVHGNGNAILNNLIKKLNYDISEKNINNLSFSYIKNIIIKAKYYIFMIIKKIYFEIILLITIILFLYI